MKGRKRAASFFCFFFFSLSLSRLSLLFGHHHISFLFPSQLIRAVSLFCSSLALAFVVEQPQTAVL